MKSVPRFPVVPQLGRMKKHTREVSRVKGPDRLDPIRVQPGSQCLHHIQPSRRSDRRHFCLCQPKSPQLPGQPEKTARRRRAGRRRRRRGDHILLFGEGGPLPREMGGGIRPQQRGGHAVAHIGIERISRLASAELELANAFNSFTEYSQRYQRPRRGDWYLPPELQDHPEAQSLYADLQEKAYDTYERLLSGLIGHLADRLPRHDGESKTLPHPGGKNGLRGRPLCPDVGHPDQSGDDRQRPRPEGHLDPPPVQPVPEIRGSLPVRWSGKSAR